MRQVPVKNLVFFLLLCLFGCALEDPAANSTLAPPSVQVVTPAELATASPALAQVIEPTRLAVASTRPVATSILPQPPTVAPGPSPERIASGRILEMWWSPDQTILYYRLPGQIWGYSLAEGAAAQFLDDDALEPVQPNLTVWLPPDVDSVSVSPGGSRALYLRPLETSPTPTPAVSSLDLGETWLHRGQVELWLWDDASVYKIGQVEDCLVDYLWSIVGDRVVMAALPPPAVCPETWAWLVDLEHKTVSSLFPKDDFPSELVAFDLSADGTRLLYRYAGILYVIDLDMLESTSLDTPLNASAHWLGDQGVVVSYKVQNNSRRVLGVYDLRTSELNVLVDPAATPGLERKLISGVQVSPDYQWVAFTSGGSMGEQDGLWLINVGGRE